MVVEKRGRANMRPALRSWQTRFLLTVVPEQRFQPAAQAICRAELVASSGQRTQLTNLVPANGSYLPWNPLYDLAQTEKQMQSHSQLLSIMPSPAPLEMWPEMLSSHGAHPPAF